MQTQTFHTATLQTIAVPDWQLQAAKNRFSQVVLAARKGVSQWVTVHGKRAAVLLSAVAHEEWLRGHDALEAIAAAFQWFDHIAEKTQFATYGLTFAAGRMLSASRHSQSTPYQLPQCNFIT